MDINVTCPNPCPICNSEYWDATVERAVKQVEGQRTLSQIKTFIRRERAKAARMAESRPQVNAQLNPKARRR